MLGTPESEARFNAERRLVLLASRVAEQDFASSSGEEGQHHELVETDALYEVARALVAALDAEGRY